MRPWWVLKMADTTLATALVAPFNARLSVRHFSLVGKNGGEVRSPSREYFRVHASKNLALPSCFVAPTRKHWGEEERRGRVFFEEPRLSQFLCSSNVKTFERKRTVLLRGNTFVSPLRRNTFLRSPHMKMRGRRRTERSGFSRSSSSSFNGKRDPAKCDKILEKNFVTSLCGGRTLKSNGEGEIRTLEPTHVS